VNMKCWETVKILSGTGHGEVLRIRLVNKSVSQSLVKIISQLIDLLNLS
jgi:hypothetical protein